MAIETTDRRFVLSTTTFNVPDFADMTFLAILGNQEHQHTIRPPRRYISRED